MTRPDTSTKESSQKKSRAPKGSSKVLTDPGATPKGKTSSPEKPPRGKNDRVQEILGLVEGLPVKDLRRLYEGLESMGLPKPTSSGGVSLKGPKPAFSGGAQKWADSDDSEGSSVVISLTSSSKTTEEKEPRVTKPSDASEATTSGPTRRTHFRKARKDLKDALRVKDPESIRKALKRLTAVSNRFGSSLEDSLPDGVDPTALKGFMDAPQSDSEGGSSGEETEVRTSVPTKKTPPKSPVEGPQEPSEKAAPRETLKVPLVTPRLYPPPHEEGAKTSASPKKL